MSEHTEEPNATADSSVKLPPVAAEVEATADLLKKYFNEEKTRQLGKPYRPHKRFRVYEVWIAAAQACIELNADPYDWIRAAFLYNNAPGGPFPHALAGNAARNWYRAYSSEVRKSGRETGSLLKDEVTALLRDIGKKMVASKKRPREFLLDEFMLPLHTYPAFCRIMLLPEDSAILLKFGKKARSELIGNQKLLSVLQELRLNLEWLEQVK